MHSIKLTLLLTVFAGVFTAAAAEESAPNILYIFTDDQSYRTVSCYPRAYNFANTPNIDQSRQAGRPFRPGLHRRQVCALTGHCTDGPAPVCR